MTQTRCCSSHELERNRSQELWFVIFSGHKMSALGLSWEPLAGSSLLPGCLGLLLPDLVGVNSVEEILPALAVLGVLHSDVDPLGQDLSADPLDDHDADGSLGDVEDTSSFAVESLVWHSLLESSAAFNIHDISDLVGLQVGGQMLNSTLLVASGEHVSGATAVSLGVSHLADCLLSLVEVNQAILAW